jgi:hypothetical protein
MAPKRQAITDADRRNIRRRRAETGETQAQTKAWFAAQPSGRTLTQGQISTITSSSYAYNMDEKGFLLGLGARTKIIYHKDFGRKLLLQGKVKVP